MRIYHTKEITKLQKAKIKSWQEGISFLGKRGIAAIVFSLVPFGYWEETDSYLYQDDHNYYCIGSDAIKRSVDNIGTLLHDKLPTKRKKN